MRNWRAGAVLLFAAATACQIGCSLILGLKDRTDLGTGGGGGGGGEGDGGIPVACLPRENSAPIDDTCGVFVSVSLGVDGAGAASKAHPFKTLAAATLAAGKAKKRVYACAETFTEAVKVTSEVAIYGGLDCKKAWAYDGTTKSKLTALPDDIPLTLTQAATSVQLFDFTVQAADAMLDGGSSIAVIANQVTASFTRCDLSAGNGKKGLDGTTPTESVGPLQTTDPAIIGNNGVNACMSTAQSLGGGSKDNVFCPAANGGPLGGAGGVGAVNSGGRGSAYPADAQTALGGTGQVVSDPAWQCIAGSGLGDHGVDGQPPLNGPGATGTAGLGQLSISGYAGVSGIPGALGNPGQGGGGGGGARGKAGCAGASGGGGGAGGCGGHGGTGGKAGGASLALVSVGATLSFEYVTVVVGGGGAGGDGGYGQGGAMGGNGGSPGAGSSGVLAACQGGAGGHGGFGGSGGGGRGGHVIGIAATGTEMPDTKGITFLKKGTPGLGGKGGPMNDGDPGVQANVQLFP